MLVAAPCTALLWLHQDAELLGGDLRHVQILLAVSDLMASLSDSWAQPGMLVTLQLLATHQGRPCPLYCCSKARWLRAVGRQGLQPLSSCSPACTGCWPEIKRLLLKQCSAELQLQGTFYWLKQGVLYALSVMTLLC